jgi:nucleoside-diphosphate-sugar epimerase
MRLSVTGGFDFIGSALIRRCLRTTRYYDVTFDKVTYAARPASLADVDSKAMVVFEIIEHKRPYRICTWDLPGIAGIRWDSLSVLAARPKRSADVCGAACGCDFSCSADCIEASPM